jgi:hypothetical protein
LSYLRAADAHKLRELQTTVNRYFENIFRVPRPDFSGQPAAPASFPHQSKNFERASGLSCIAGHACPNSRDWFQATAFFVTPFWTLTVDGSMFAQIRQKSRHFGRPQ